MLHVTYDKKCIYKNGKPWIPFCGEMHYSRVPEEEWRTELAKMKSGGLDCVSTYIFWNHHEFIKGKYNFSGNRNLKKFCQLCREADLNIILRLGPWCHGEARYGGFPDWLVQECTALRSDDELYLYYVKIFWKKIFEQIREESENIVAIQIENEYLFGGENCGDTHMRTLMGMAKEIGFSAPLFTATGWVSAFIGDCLPTFCGYVCAPWARTVEKLPFNDNYMMKYDQNEFIMDNEFNLVHMAKTPHFDRTQFPYLTCELGGGIQVTRHRRPVIGKDDIGAMALVKLATGINMFGWYMYHGGTNPVTGNTYLQESVETGYPNDYPRLSYDFQAPIREYGQISPSYKELKLYALFLHDFGSELALMNTVLPAGKMYPPDDTEHLRIALRKNEKSGYIFVNNFVRREKMHSHKNIRLKVELKDEIIEYPERKIQNGDYFFYPFNLQIGKGCLKYAEASPLCILNNEEEKTYVFYSAKKMPGYRMEGEAGNSKLLFISKEQALNAYKTKIGEKEFLIVTASGFYKKESRLIFTGNNRFKINTYPALPAVPAGFSKCGRLGRLFCYEKTIPENEVVIPTFEKILYGEGSTYKIKIPKIKKCADAFLRLNFAGDYVALYNKGILVADDYYKDGEWEVSLKRLGFPSELYLKITPIFENDWIYLEKKPKYVNRKACELYRTEIRFEYETEMKFI